MTNHVHLLTTPREPGGVSRMMQAIGRRYVGKSKRSLSAPWYSDHAAGPDPTRGNEPDPFSHLDHATSLTLSAIDTEMGRIV